jgi:transposase
MNRPQPKSVSGRIRAVIASAGDPVSTRDIAKQFGLSSSVASAFLIQLRCRGEIRQVSYGRSGKYATPATWGRIGA